MASSVRNRITLTMPKRIPPDQKAAAMATIIERVSAGVPLAEVVRAEGMPGLRTVYDWADEDQEFSARIARARELGFDQIAVDALKIADDTSRDTIETPLGVRMDAEWVARSKLRVETRLKLLAKWDPKRYGDKLALGGAADLPPVQSNVTVDAGEAYKLLLAGGGKPDA